MPPKPGQFRGQSHVVVTSLPSCRQEVEHDYRSHKANSTRGSRPGQDGRGCCEGPVGPALRTTDGASNRDPLERDCRGGAGTKRTWPVEALGTDPECGLTLTAVHGTRAGPDPGALKLGPVGTEYGRVPVRCQMLGSSSMGSAARCSGPGPIAGLARVSFVSSCGAVLVAPFLASDSHAGGRLLNRPRFSDSLPPTPPAPDLATWKFPLGYRDVLRIAIVFLAVLITAEEHVRGGMDVEAGQGADLGVGQRLMAEPADPHGLGGRAAARGASVAVAKANSWVTETPSCPSTATPRRPSETTQGTGFRQTPRERTRFTPR